MRFRDSTQFRRRFLNPFNFSRRFSSYHNYLYVISLFKWNYFLDSSEVSITVAVGPPMERKVKSREREQVYKFRDAISLRGVHSLSRSTFPPFSQRERNGLNPPDVWQRNSSPAPIKHFYPICIQDFHKFARFYGASAIKHRTRRGSAPWKYSAGVTSRRARCVMLMPRLADALWRLVFLQQRSRRFLCVSICDTVRLSESGGSLTLFVNPFLFFREKNGRSSRLRAVDRSRNFRRFGTGKKTEEDCNGQRISRMNYCGNVEWNWPAQFKLKWYLFLTNMNI